MRLLLRILYFPKIYTRLVVSSILVRISVTSHRNVSQINFPRLQIKARVYQKLHRKFFAGETSDIDPTEDSHRAVPLFLARR